jgi:hypothetical protein
LVSVSHALLAAFLAPYQDGSAPAYVRDDLVRTTIAVLDVFPNAPEQVFYVAIAISLLVDAVRCGEIAAESLAVLAPRLSWLADATDMENIREAHRRLLEVLDRGDPA